jgi:hypothetical protein
MNYQKLTIYTLVLSIFTLSWMVPGGPVETRDFSHLAPQIAWAFNIFLTSLILLAIALIYFLFKKQKWAYQLTGVVGFAFFLVFVLDLGKIFPVSPDPMSPLLLLMEILGLIFGILLMWLAYKTIKMTDISFWLNTTKLPNMVILIGVTLLFFGAFVVYFATSSTLNF